MFWDEFTVVLHQDDYDDDYFSEEHDLRVVETKQKYHAISQGALHTEDELAPRTIG